MNTTPRDLEALRPEDRPVLPADAVGQSVKEPAMTEETGFPPEPDLPLPQRTPGEALARAQSGTEDERGAEVLINPVTPTRPRYRFAGIAVPVAEWTVDPETNRSNSSAEYLRLVDEVARLIGSSAHSLVGAGPTGIRQVAMLIMAQLAHVHGLAPAGSTPELEGEQAKVSALLAEVQRLRKDAAG